MCFRKGMKRNRLWTLVFFGCQLYTTNVHLSCLELKKNIYKLLKAWLLITLYFYLCFFFLLPFWITRLCTVLNSFSPLPTSFSRWREREMSTFSRANALCKYHIYSPGWQGAWQPRMPASLAWLWSSPQALWVVLAIRGSLWVDKGSSPESQSLELII